MCRIDYSIDGYIDVCRVDYRIEDRCLWDGMGWASLGWPLNTLPIFDNWQDWLDHSIYSLTFGLFGHDRPRIKLVRNPSHVIGYAQILFLILSPTHTIHDWVDWLMDSFDWFMGIIDCLIDPLWWSCNGYPSCSSIDSTLAVRVSEHQPLVLGRLRATLIDGAGRADWPPSTQFCWSFVIAVPSMA